MANQIIEQAKVNMGKTEESLQRELGNIRAGRANASLLNQITVDYYGAPNAIEPNGGNHGSGSTSFAD